MSKRSHLTVLDLLVLVAATATGLALTRSLPEHLAIRRHIHVAVRASETTITGWGMGERVAVMSPAARPFRTRPSYWLIHLGYWTAPCLASWSLAATALEFRRPGRSLRRLARRPGPAAGLALLLAMLAESIRFFQFSFEHGRSWSVDWAGWGPWAVYWISLPRIAGFAVAVSWLTLALSGRWMSESGATGWLGRAIGAGWIVLAFLNVLGDWFMSQGH
jgi:hypothetical protein